MGKRSDLHKKLKTYFKGAQIYFQPPESIKLSYPCLLYWMDSYEQQFADDTTYTGKARYTLQYITKNPDDEKTLGALTNFQMIRLDNFFAADNLNHYNYTLYY